MMNTETPIDWSSRIVRYDDLVPCTSAFIDTHTPGSDRKENFTIIGAGVSESAEQHVHIPEPHGFNIGAARQPPGCHNSLHAHRTAEVFMVLSGRWRFCWGRYGTAGAVELSFGDVINIPTHIFRGFANIGDQVGTLLAILGGDDAGGGVIWTPEVLKAAEAHGLVLSERGKLYDRKQGQSLPAAEKPMPPLSEAELKGFGELPVHALVRDYIARFDDLCALAQGAPAEVIGPQALLKDRPGFTLRFVTADSSTAEQSWDCGRQHVLIGLRGQWNVRCQAKDQTEDQGKGQEQRFELAAGDTLSVPTGSRYQLKPLGADAALFHVEASGDAAGATWMPGRTWPPQAS